ncbi:MAG: hypothetical protein IKO65_08060, partial [Victivallales bacterium]|nr:hypothetical protein [Victivallales bacterium]
SAEIPFALRYHYAKIGDAGSHGKPLWSGAEAGKWTMDYDAAVEWSAANVKPFLLYFGGCTWCPSCVSFEHLVVETTGFKGATKNLPMVMLDNRRRGEVTGPTLLYAPDYQMYVQSVAATVDVEEKLRANKQLQTTFQEPGKIRVNYPSMLLCQGNDDGSVRVISRVDLENYYPYGIFYSPVGTDFSAFGATTMAKLMALLDDPYEESDNYASTTQVVLRLSDDVAGVEWAAKIGGYDTTDWRLLHLDSSHSWRFAVAGDDFDSAATVTIGLYDELGTGAADGNLLAIKVGTGAALPYLDFVPDEFRSDTDWNCRLKISVDGQDSPVDYTLVCSDSNQVSYEIAFSQPVFYARACEGSTQITATWSRLQQTVLEGQVELESDGVGVTETTYSFGAGNEATDGVLHMTVLVPSIAGEKGEAVEGTVTLVPAEANGNCCVKAPATATIKTFALPGFAEYRNGDTVEIPLELGVPMEKRIAFVNGVTDDTGFILSNMLPDGISMQLVRGTQAGLGELVIYGTPTRMPTETQTVVAQLRTSENPSHSGAILLIVFKTNEMESVNPVAARTNNYSGYIFDSKDGQVTGAFSLSRQVDWNFAVTASFIDAVEPVIGTAPAWELLADNSVQTTVDLNGEKLELTLSQAGVGTGTYGGKQVSFLPVMDVAMVAAEYAGTYNVSLESSHPAYQGYGWLVVEIDGEGLVTYTGKLPDGMNVVKRTTHLVEEHDNGVFTVVAFDGSDFVSGRAQITPRSQREDGEPCVSAGVGDDYVFCWHDAAGGIYRLSPCGSGYDRETKKIMAQIKNHEGENYEKLFFYALTMPYATDVPESYPDGICPQLLPAGVEIVEADDGGAFMVADYDGQAARPYKDLAIDISFDDKGLLEGFFNVFDAVTGLPSQLTFKGILTPIPASCCSAGPEALGYGTILSNDGMRSWPVRIVPDRYDGPMLRAPTISTTTTIVTATGAEDGKLCTYVLLNKEGTIQAIAADGIFPWRDLETPGSYSVAVVANGMIGGSVPMVTTTTTFVIELADGDTFDVGEEDDVSRGWLAWTMPTSGMVLDGIPVEAPNNAKAGTVSPIFIVFAYPEGATAPVRITDWSELEPGQAFWVYFNKAAVGTSKTLVSEEGVKVVEIDAVVPREASGEFVFQRAPEPLLEGVQFWNWNGDVYRRDTEGIGWLQNAE